MAEVISCVAIDLSFHEPRWAVVYEGQLLPARWGNEREAKDFLERMAADGLATIEGGRPRAAAG